MLEERNSKGLFDLPVPFKEKAEISMNRSDFERQLDEGAFMLTREQAIKQGLINPDYEPDTVIACFQEEA